MLLTMGSETSPTFWLLLAKQDVDWIITNPPFRLAEQFILKALNHATEGVAMLVRTSFLESIGRYSSLFSVRPPTRGGAICRAGSHGEGAT